MGRLTYLTLNIQGSCNNLCDTAPDPDEYAARNAANIQWMKQSFADAAARGSAAVMIISQGDPGWDKSDATRAPLHRGAIALGGAYLPVPASGCQRYLGGRPQPLRPVDTRALNRTVGSTCLWRGAWGGT